MKSPAAIQTITKDELNDEKLAAQWSETLKKIKLKQAELDKILIKLIKG